MTVEISTVRCPKVPERKMLGHENSEKWIVVYPLEVPVYWSVHGAPFGKTVPINVQAVRSLEVLISIPTAVAIVKNLFSPYLRPSVVDYDLQKTK